MAVFFLCEQISIRLPIEIYKDQSIQCKKLEREKQTTANQLIKFKLLRQYQSVEINNLEK